MPKHDSSSSRLSKYTNYLAAAESNNHLPKHLAAAEHQSMHSSNSSRLCMAATAAANALLECYCNNHRLKAKLLKCSSCRSHGVATCLSLSLIVSGFLSLSLRSNGVASCLSLSPLVVCCHSLSPMVAGCPSLSVPHHGVATCLSMSPMVTDCTSLSLHSHGVAACLLLFPIVAACL